MSTPSVFAQTSTPYCPYSLIRFRENIPGGNNWLPHLGMHLGFELNDADLEMQLVVDITELSAEDRHNRITADEMQRSAVFSARVKTELAALACDLQNNLDETLLRHDLVQKNVFRSQLLRFESLRDHGENFQIRPRSGQVPTQRWGFLVNDQILAHTRITRENLANLFSGIVIGYRFIPIEIYNTPTQASYVQAWVRVMENLTREQTQGRVRDLDRGDVVIFAN